MDRAPCTFRCDVNCVVSKWGGLGGKGGCRDGSETGSVGCICKQGVTPVSVKTGRPLGSAAAAQVNPSPSPNPDPNPKSYPSPNPNPGPNPSPNPNPNPNLNPNPNPSPGPRPPPHPT